jgi:16S rRNA (uracil1498-N3)-methyltransferase
VSLLVGPEGGLTPLEVQSAEARGWQVVTLGRRILRAETAAVAAAAVTMALWGELGRLD